MIRLLMRLNKISSKGGSLIFFRERRFAGRLRIKTVRIVKIDAPLKVVHEPDDIELGRNFGVHLLVIVLFEKILVIFHSLFIDFNMIMH